MVYVSVVNRNELKLVYVGKVIQQRVDCFEIQKVLFKKKKVLKAQKTTKQELASFVLATCYPSSVQHHAVTMQNHKKSGDNTLCMHCTEEIEKFIHHVNQQQANDHLCMMKAASIYFEAQHFNTHRNKILRLQASFLSFWYC